MTQMVSDIQTQLRMRGYDIPVVSGVVDMRTTEAIRAYQADAGLPITGMASATLLAHLQLGTSPGMTQDEIVRLKAALSARGYDPGPHDGVVGPRLRDAIRTYQADAGVPVTGEPSASLVAQLEAGTSVDLTPAEVLRLKAALSARGYDPGPHDSLDGPELRAAIRDYQADARLPVTGEPSASLIADLEAGAQPAELVVEVDDTAWLTELEGALQNRRYYVGEVDGVIDDRTRTAISAYQRDAGLPITGEPSTELLIQLRSSPVQNIGGTASSIVWQIENELHNRGFAVGPIDGTVDQQTELAIVSFQRHAGIQRTGKADYALLQHLEMFQSVRNNGQEVSLVVWRIEDELSRRGYVTGPVDGSIDESTVQAIEAYQHDQGLRVTGEADTQLLGYIEGSSLRRISQR
jgi:peptidoglycan hydrolase-like protein with peptidoglycan-binding domain